ncbi:MULTISPECIES: NAD(P)H-binding protein [Roseivirga]|jgi:nucleoside-diphosphate-sugar epimerase|uniref:Epimerase n=1 Tax=Roseivirga spongicola TaxID=333140 RepID=A0A150X5V4_9BACT|nr:MULTISPECIES: NAD(P)H-binding protein [Roseivirga]KYG74101.1 epimerase [Roseivirga spongicola]MBO6660415.1 NAD(P)H-binding protein [Roseivirga sp.]MBO6759928.1 NAD(P)H-binding protein [Roseivirga sp.]MBO6906848.1 NAD(P)H-binding protein [Roseivirga sp.]WPZ09246.1 NAD(P)H-binding protein [Roseivirga spongicola]
MKVLVIGASGRVGQKLTSKLLEADHQVVGTTRKDEKLFEANNYSQIALDLEKSAEDLSNEIPSDVEAVYFVSGSRGKDLLNVDLHGAIKSMQAAEMAGIKRYVMLSTIYSLQPTAWDTSADLYDYMIAKHYADQWLIKNTDLDYTILQPGSLTENAGTGEVELKVQEHGENPIEDVAEVLFGLLDLKSSFKEVIPMRSGDTPIKNALANL